MKRTLAVTGFTMLATLLAFCNTTGFKAINVALAAAFVAFLFSVICKKSRERKTLPTVFLFVIAALTVLSINEKIYKTDSALYNDKSVEISGHLVSVPYKQNGKSYYIIKTDTIGKENKKLNIRLVSSSPVELEPEDEFTGTVKIFSLGADSDSYLNYYKAKNLTFGAYIVGEIHIQKDCRHNIGQLLLKLRINMINEITHILPNDYGAVISGLLLGDKSNLSDKTKNSFKFCGVSHLFAVSGLHISTWSLLVYEFLRKLRLSNKSVSLISAAFCLFFMALTGFNPPIVRSGIMMIMIYISNLFELEADSINSIGFALTVMLFINPYSAVDVSLLLSVLATLGILILFPTLYSSSTSKIKNIKNTVFKNFLLSVVSIICVSISVTVFTVPIYIFSFESISTLNIIANLLMIFSGSLCMEIAGIAAILCVAKLYVFGKPLMLFAGVISRFLTKTSHLLSSFRYSVLPLNTELSTAVIIIFLFVFLLIYFVKFKSEKAKRILCTATAVSFIFVNLLSFMLDFGKLKLAVADVGNGTAIIMSYKGKNIIFSCGGEYFAESAICDIMNTYGISTVDYLCLPKGASHYERILNSYNVKHVYAEDIQDFENIKLNCDVIKINKSEILIDKLILGITESYAVILFGKSRIFISFSDNFSLAENYDCDILIYSSNLPDGINSKFIVSSCANKGNSRKDTYYVSENGGISFSINNENTFKYRRIG